MRKSLLLFMHLFPCLQSVFKSYKEKLFFLSTVYCFNTTVAGNLLFIFPIFQITASVSFCYTALNHLLCFSFFMTTRCSGTCFDNNNKKYLHTIWYYYYCNYNGSRYKCLVSLHDFSALSSPFKVSGSCIRQYPQCAIFPDQFTVLPSHRSVKTIPHDQI